MEAPRWRGNREQCPTRCSPACWTRSSDSGCSESHYDSGKPRLHFSNVGAGRQVEHGLSHSYDAELHPRCVDGELHSFRKLEFTPCRQRNRPTGIENPRVEQPAIHAGPGITRRMPGVDASSGDDALQKSIVADLERAESLGLARVDVA